MAMREIEEKEATISFIYPTGRHSDLPLQLTKLLGVKVLEAAFPPKHQISRFEIIHCVHVSLTKNSLWRSFAYMS